MKPKYSSRNTLAIAAGCSAIVLALTPFSAQAAPGNTKTGTNAGASLTTGRNNTADGFSALQRTTTGKSNTAVGALSLNRNISGAFNTATGVNALNKNTTGLFNTANGVGALQANTSGQSNVAVGYQALNKNVSGKLNAALGDGALFNNTGNQNIGIGEDAGFNLTTGSNNIAIGNDGVAGESNMIRIGTDGVHTDTFLSGVIHGNGSGLTGLKIPSSSITGTITNAQLTNGSVNNSKLATNLTLGGTTKGTFTGNLTGNASTANIATNFSGALAGDITGTQGATAIKSGAVTSSKLATNLTLGGTTTGNFKGNLTGNASRATVAGSFSTPNSKLSETNSGTFGGAEGYEFDFGTVGLLLETRGGFAPTDSGGLFLNDDTAVLYSPGDNGNILSVYDEDFFGVSGAVPAFTVLNANAGISTPGVVYQGPNNKYRSTADEEGLKIVRGGVDYTGSILKGSAYTVAKSSTGTYDITFTTPFISPPSVTGNAHTGNNYTLSTYGVTTSSVRIYINNKENMFEDCSFDFIAIGPR